MTTPARQPQGIPTGGQFTADSRAEPTVTLAHEPAAYTAEMTGTIELHNQWFEKLPEWPAGMPEPEVSFGFDDGKAETYLTVDGKMMTFWDSDMDGTISDSAHGASPWEDFEDADQEMAEAWGKAVHERIDSSTYGVMIEGSHSPAVRDIILAQATGKEPSPAAPETDAAPDLKNEAARNAYLIGAEARLADATREVQGIYMIGAAKELSKDFPEIDSFQLTVGGKGLEIAEAWDADGNPVDRDITAAASREVFRHRNEDDLHTFVDEQTITVQDAIDFRPGN